jgi:hypothetical protein
LGFALATAVFAAAAFGFAADLAARFGFDAVVFADAAGCLGVAM